MQPSQLPMVYSKLYNIGFCGIENFHPFDSKKFSKIVANLTARGLLRHCQVRLLHGRAMQAAMQ